MITITYVQHTKNNFDPVQDRAIRSGASERRTLRSMAQDLGLSKDQLKRRVQHLGVGVGNNLRPGILDTLERLQHPLRPVTRAMLSRHAPGNRSALCRVINDMLSKGELRGNAKDIRHPTIPVGGKLGIGGFDERS